jgi:hypothetical protein
MPGDSETRPVLVRERHARPAIERSRTITGLQS